MKIPGPCNLGPVCVSLLSYEALAIVLFQQQQTSLIQAFLFLFSLLTWSEAALCCFCDSTVDLLLRPPVYVPVADFLWPQGPGGVDPLLEQNLPGQGQQSET